GLSGEGRKAVLVLGSGALDRREEALQPLSPGRGRVRLRGDAEAVRHREAGSDHLTEIGPLAAHQPDGPGFHVRETHGQPVDGGDYARSALRRAAALLKGA